MNVLGENPAASGKGRNETREPSSEGRQPKSGFLGLPLGRSLTRGFFFGSPAGERKAMRLPADVSPFSFLRTLGLSGLSARAQHGSLLLTNSKGEGGFGFSPLPFSFRKIGDK